MPYIAEPDADARAKLEEVADVISSAGELNWAVTTLCDRFLRGYKATSEASYEERQVVYGTLLAAAAEWYRRILAPYEDRKKEVNGDVYTQALHVPGKIGSVIA